ncbi:MAG: glycoside hydrolase family 130 protein [Gemmatimonadaceae bacterium]
MSVQRASTNPILTPSMISPSRPELEVVGVFNPGAVRHGDEVVLLVRVSEAPRDIAAGDVAALVYVPPGRLDLKSWPRNAAGVDASDPRMVVVDGKTWLTSISHLRVARSRDGIHFTVEAAPALAADSLYESFGVEDARITHIDDTYWINYTAVSPLGIATGLASTRDFRTFERHGIIFPPNNRDVTIFPERIEGKFHALHRPMPSGFGGPAIWIASSPDMMSWGDHRLVASGRDGGWEGEKIGGGAVPFRVSTGGVEGWLAVYHGVGGSPSEYSLGALLLDARDPSRVIARTRVPILRPEAAYERDGFFGGVVFTCGLVTDGDQLRVYYGAADGVTAVADLSLDAIVASLE